MFEELENIEFLNDPSTTVVLPSHLLDLIRTKDWQLPVHYVFSVTAYNLTNILVPDVWVEDSLDGIHHLLYVVVEDTCYDDECCEHTWLEDFKSPIKVVCTDVAQNRSLLEIHLLICSENHEQEPLDRVRKSSERYGGDNSQTLYCCRRRETPSHRNMNARGEEWVNEI
ncbi:non-heme halogenase [Moniliophthora roreri]|nr:non-heme halogenase [Moniliophthora roreri]